MVTKDKRNNQTKLKSLMDDLTIISEDKLLLPKQMYSKVQKWFGKSDSTYQRYLRELIDIFPPTDKNDSNYKLYTKATSLDIGVFIALGKTEIGAKEPQRRQIMSKIDREWLAKQFVDDPNGLRTFLINNGYLN